MKVHELRGGVDEEVSRRDLDKPPGCNEPQKGNGIGSGIHPIRRVSVVGQRASSRVRVRGRGQACAGEQRSEGGEDEGPMTCVKLQAASARVGMRSGSSEVARRLL